MIDELRPYPEMKPTGLGWLGDVPAHWNVFRSKYVFREIDKRSKTGEEIHLSMSQRLGLVPAAQVEQRALVSESYIGGKLVEENDLVLNRLKAHLGVFAYAKQSGLISPDYTVLRPNGDVDVRFFEFVLKSHPCRAELRTRAKGIVEGFWRLYTDDFYTIFLPFPPLDEQQLIVRFLDWHGRQTAKLIRAKKKLIALLNEQKQAIIYNTVTRGLDPNVKLKFSGVPWLGDIPDGWKVKRLRAISRQITSGSRGWSRYAADNGPLFIRIGNLTRTGVSLDLRHQVRLNFPSHVSDEAGRSRVDPGDILMSITAYIGSVALAPSDIGESYVSQHVGLCRLRVDEASPIWVAYVLFSAVGRNHGSLCMYGGTKQGLSLDDVKNYPILLPPHDEQDQLARHIELKTANLDTRIAVVESEIALLYELRTRLISDVVTGKLDVRLLAAGLPDIAEPGSVDELIDDTNLEEVLDEVESEEVAA